MSWKFPTTCPSCSSTLERRGVHYFCPNNLGCQDQILCRLEHAIGKGALDWQGVGPKFIESLVKNFNVKNLGDLLDPVIVGAAVDDTVASLKYMRHAVESNDRPLWRKLYSLGIEHIGQTLSKELSSRYPSLSDMANDPNLHIHTGPVAARSLTSWYAANGDLLARLASYGFILEQTVTIETIQGAASGRTFVITGSLQTGSRPQVAELIERHGGVVKGGVNKKIDYLVVGMDAGGTKTEAAKKHGTKCLSEEELYELLGVPMQATRVIPEEF
jgi:DNA ligase (NAD+)